VGWGEWVESRPLGQRKEEEQEHLALTQLLACPGGSLFSGTGEKDGNFKLKRESKTQGIQNHLGKGSLLGCKGTQQQKERWVEDNPVGRRMGDGGPRLGLQGQQ